jgi:hypothetical protein
MRQRCSTLHVRRTLPLQGVLRLRKKLRLRGEEVGTS